MTQRKSIQRTETVLQMIDTLYDGVLDPACRIRASRQTANSVGAHLTALWCVSTDYRNVSLYDHGDSPAITTYLSDWADRDGVIDGVFRNFLGQTVDMNMLDQAVHPLRSEPAFEGYYERLDLVNAAGHFRTLTPGWIGAVAILRGRRSGAFTERDLALVNAVAPHIQHSLRLSLQLEWLESRNAAADNLLHDMQLIGQVCTPSGHLLEVNAHAERALREHEFGLSIRHNRLVYDDPSTQERFRAALRGVEVCSRVPAEIRVPRPDNEPVWCTVLPLPGNLDRSTRNACNALFILERRQDRRAVSRERLARTLPISPSECDVLVGFMRGEDPRTIAENRGCTYESIRRYEKSRRSKIGCHSRAKAVAQAWKSVAAIRRSGDTR